MTDSGQLRDHDEIRQLLPWYLNGSLAEREVAIVQRHVDACPECNADLALHRRMQEAVLRDRATPIVPVRSGASLLDRADARRPGGVRRTGGKWLALAAAAALAAVTTLVAWQLGFAPENDARTFRTATSDGPAAESGYVLRIRFEEGTSRVSRDRIVRELGATGVRGLEDPQLFELLMHVPDASLDDLEKIAGEATERDEVSSAEFVALQLPVR